MCFTEEPHNGRGIVVRGILAKVYLESPEKASIPARRAKYNLDAIHDTVHEMARDEARHGKAFKGLLERYFK